jgi:hypothetical protein
VSESAKVDLERLKDLNPEARERVESALKAAIEREAAEANIGGSALAGGNMFSRGWIFSRITPTAVDARLINEAMELDKLSAEEFSSFANRLAEVKRLTDAQR